jgi:hypothetical protein
MALVTQRVWKRGRRKVRRVAWGYTMQSPDGRQVRSFREDWTKEDAEKALAAALLEQKTPKPGERPTLTFGDAVTRYLQAKSRKKSLKDDERHLAVFKTAFGAGTALTVRVISLIEGAVIEEREGIRGAPVGAA